MPRGHEPAREHCGSGTAGFGAFAKPLRLLESAIPPAAKEAAAIDDLPFEGALKELEAIVSRLEQGEVDLEDSIALYERGQALKAHCEKKLKSAEGRLEKIVMGAAGPQIGESMETV